MDDQELLELAAKAAGYDVSVAKGGGAWINDGSRVWPQWNPLINDGDALRIAVKLNLCSKRFGDLIEVVAPKGSSFGIVCEQGIKGTDLMEAYRRAIVRAAAEIGENMP